MRPLDNAISVGDRRAEAESSESTTLTGLRRASDIPLPFRLRFRRDLGLTALAQLGVLGINTLTGLLAARLLGPQVRGQLAALTLRPGALIFLTHPGIDAALVFHVGKQRFRFSEVWTAGAVLGILQTLLVIPVGLLVIPLALRSYPVGVRHLAVIFLCFAPSIIFVGQLTSLLQGKLRLAAYNLVRMIAPAAYALGSNLNANEAGRIISRSFQACLVCLGLGCSLLCVIVPWLIPFAFGRDFGGAVLACRILLPGAVALGLSQVLYDGARALGHPALPAHAEGCSLIVTLGCLYLLVPRFGFVGAALASTLAYGTSLVAAFVLLKRRAGLGWRDLVGLSNPTLRRVFSDGSR